MLFTPPTDSRLGRNRRPKNRLLQALPEEDFQRLLPDLKTIPTVAKQIFHISGKPLDYVYFPNGGVASVTAVLSDGMMVETVTVGLEGMVGIEAYFGEGALAPGETMMQVPDTNAEQLSISAFRREIARQGAFSHLIGRYAQAALALMMQSTACNARHKIEERCARWLLMTHDRVGCDDFQLSHEFLAVMLGVRRQSVTLIAGTLQAARLITYRHGRMRILDRAGLEASACECYILVRNRFKALLP
jgi:CRP-like cAMP-binding protein